MHDEEITEAIIGAAIEVHRHLGPGLLESAYRRCLAHELELRGVEVATEMPVDLRYKRLEIAASYRIDLLVADRVMVEAKTVDQITPLHEAQLLTYLRLSGRKSGLLLNFKVRLLKDGIVRRVLQQPPLNHPRPATPLSGPLHELRDSVVWIDVSLYCGRDRSSNTTETRRTTETARRVREPRCSSTPGRRHGRGRRQDPRCTKRSSSPTFSCMQHPRPATPLSVLPSVSSVTPWWFVASLRSLPPSPQPSPPIGEREGGSPSPCGQRG
ncbi:MAG: GxxExxY protein [Myxococcales bacterium]|nr:GxxExxY protein [Myxococcales bacterium]